MPATLADVEQLVGALPGVEVGARWGNRTWLVGKNGFVWERPLTKADVRRLAGAPVPSGPLVAARVADLAEKEGVLAVGHKGVFTIEHFKGYPAVLVQLDVVHKRVLRELVVDAWLACAPRVLANAYVLAERAPRPKKG